MDMETARLILYDRSTGVVALTVVDALPLAELEGLLELRHVFNVNCFPVSGEKSTSMRTCPCGPDSSIKQKMQGSSMINATHDRLPPGGRSIAKSIHSGVELNRRTFLDPGPVGNRDASRGEDLRKAGSCGLSDRSLSLYMNADLRSPRGTSRWRTAATNKKV